MPLRKIRAERANVRESDIIAALAQSNRSVTPEMLASWRRRGLLPAFDRKGAARGRIFHWTGSDIVGRAQYIFDALSQDRPLGEIYTGLWMAGYDVPLAVFRRSWRDWLRTKNHWKLSPPWLGHARQYETSFFQLLATGLATIDGFSSFEIALNTMTQALFGDRRPLRTETVLLLHSLALAFERSDLLEKTSDQRLAQAQSYLVNLLAALNAATSGTSQNALPPVWPVFLSIQIGSPLLWMILSLMSFGYEERLEASNAVLREFTELLARKPRRSKSTDAARLGRLQARLAELWSPLLSATYCRSPRLVET